MKEATSLKNSWMVAVLLLVLVGPMGNAAVVTFDDPPCGEDDNYLCDLPSDYAGFTWSGGLFRECVYVGSFGCDIPSRPCIAVLEPGDTFSVSGDPFDFIGAYLDSTGCFGDGKGRIRVEGFRDGTLKYSRTVEPDEDLCLTWFSFYFEGVDKVQFVLLDTNCLGLEIDDFTYERAGEALLAAFDYSPQEPVVGDTIQFTDYSTGGTPPYEYEWDFEDDGVIDSTDMNPSHKYNEAGEYTVTLTVTDNDGLTDTAMLSLRVKGKEFMITFDDGPIPGQTDSILLQLKNCKVDGEPVKAAFFMIGDPNPLYYKPPPLDIEWDKGSVKKNHALVRYVAEEDLKIGKEGHVVGNHTQHHAWFAKWLLFGFHSMEEFVEDEISKCNSEIEKALGKNPPKIFRAPYLQERDYPLPIYGAAGQLGFTVVGGEVADISDWLLPSITDVQEKARGILESWEEDEPRVLVFHDNRSVTYNHIGEIISYLQNEGYTLAHFDPGRIPRQTQPSAEGIKEVLSGIARCPVDLVVTDPEGLVLSKEQNRIPDALYKEIDVDEDGELDDFFVIPKKKIGRYLIQVIPEPGVSPTDTYSLEVAANGVLVTLAEDVQVKNIPLHPYIVRSNETGITHIIPVTTDFDPDTLNLKSKGNWITCYIELPEGYDVDDIDVGSILLEYLLEIQHSDVQDDVLMVKFDRQDVIAYIELVLEIEVPADVILMVTGELTDGTSFEGTDTIRAIDEGKNKESKGMNKKSKGKNKK